MPVSGPQRYCPSCGLKTDAAFCPEDGVSTVERRRLDVDVTAIHAGDVIEGRYRVTGVLGRGGFGAVYSAEHTGTQQPVALKMMLADPASTDEGETRRQGPAAGQASHGRSARSCCPEAYQANAGQARRTPRDDEKEEEKEEGASSPCQREDVLHRLSRAPLAGLWHR